MAAAAKFTIAEVEELVEPGMLDPNHIHTPCIYVDALVVTETKERPIEFRSNTENMAISADLHTNPKYALRVKIARRAAKFVENGQFLNLGIGMPTLVPLFIPDEYTVSM